MNRLEFPNYEIVLIFFNAAFIRFDLESNKININRVDIKKNILCRKYFDVIK